MYKALRTATALSDREIRLRSGTVYAASRIILAVSI